MLQFLESQSPDTAQHAPSSIDENGVDRAQIKRMLAMSPRERVRWLEDVWQTVERVRKLNGVPKVR
jgi:hypothetical protein